MVKRLSRHEGHKKSETENRVTSAIRDLTARWNAIKIEDDGIKVQTFLAETAGAFEKFKGHLVINRSLRPPFERVDLTKL